MHDKHLDTWQDIFDRVIILKFGCQFFRSLKSQKCSFQSYNAWGKMRVPWQFREHCCKKNHQITKLSNFFSSFKITHSPSSIRHLTLNNTYLTKLSFWNSDTNFFIVWEDRGVHSNPIMMEVKCEYHGSLGSIAIKKISIYQIFNFFFPFLKKLTH